MHFRKLIRALRIAISASIIFAGIGIFVGSDPGPHDGQVFLKGHWVAKPKPYVAPLSPLQQLTSVSDHLHTLQCDVGAAVAYGVVYSNTSAAVVSARGQITQGFNYIGSAQNDLRSNNTRAAVQNIAAANTIAVDVDKMAVTSYDTTGC